MTTAFAKLIGVLADAQVRFVVVGGVALVARGGARLTDDLDVVYDRAVANLDRLAAAVGPLHPRLRGAPADLPFFFDARTLKAGLNFTLSTDAGDLDLLGEIAGVGPYAAVLALASTVPMFGRDVPTLDLDGLARAKRAAGRAKDLLDLEMIAALKAERSKG